MNGTGHPASAPARSVDKCDAMSTQRGNRSRNLSFQNLPVDVRGTPSMTS